MKKIIIILLVCSFYFVSLVFFGAIVRHVSQGGPYSETFIAKFADNLSQIPSNIKTYLFGGNQTVERLENVVKRETSRGIKKYKKSKVEEYILISSYFNSENTFKLQLIDILNDQIIHTWDPSKFFAALSTSEASARYTFEHSKLLENGDVLISSGNKPILRINPCSEIIWKSQIRAHHSKELDHEKNIWAPIYIENDERYFKGTKLKFHDGIVKININNGEILFIKSLVDILKENKLFDLIGNSYYGNDPIHLNDIQPVLKDNKFWKKGDIFMSMRNISLVIHYRPSTNKVLWYQFGPWRHQHDIDIINDTTIAVFNNNTKLNLKLVNNNSNIISYDFEKNKIAKPFEKLFIRNKIRTYYEGLFEKIDQNHIFVEEQENGRVLKGNKDGEIIWEYIWDAKVKWSRYYSQEHFKKYGNLNETIKKIKNTKCG
jgi:hypothetical protein